MTVIDATTLVDPTTGDEVLALYLSYAEPGDVVTIHAATCPVTRDAGWRCRCTPQTMTVGARA